MQDERVTVIRPRTGWSLPDAAEIWHHRDLLLQLVLRDVRVRYKQTALGAAWAVLQPVATMVVFAIFFGGLAGVPSDGGRYWLFALAGLVPWTFFATGLNQAAMSLVSNSAIVTKVYFPRALVPMAGMLAALVDLAVSLLVLMVVATFAGHPPSTATLSLPLFVILGLVTGLGTGMFLAAINVLYRDVRYVLPFIIQLWLFTTPVAYSATLISDRWQTLYAANPMASVVQGFRWSIIDGPAPRPMGLLASTVVALLMFLLGAITLNRVESDLADVV